MQNGSVFCRNLPGTAYGPERGASIEPTGLSSRNLSSVIYKGGIGLIKVTNPMENSAKFIDMC